MKLLFYELRKSYFRFYILAGLMVLSVLDVTKIVMDYQQGITDRAVMENEDNLRAIADLSYIFNGKITAEKAAFLEKEEKRLGDIYDKRLNQYNPKEKTYSGNLYEDYRLLEVYFVPQYRYMVEYQQFSEDITKYAVENVNYYGKKKNVLKVKENAYIANVYSDRQLQYYARTNCEKTYLSYSFSFWLIVLLCFLGVAPAFQNESACGMSYLLRTSKKGGIPSTMTKIIAAFLYGIFLVLWFCLLDYVCYSFTQGFGAMELPIWAISDYQKSFLNCSIFSFIIYRAETKIIAILMIISVLLFLSVFIKKIIYCMLPLAGLLFIWYKSYNFLFSTIRWKQIIGSWNPFTLFGNVKMYQEFHIMEIGKSFYLCSDMCLIGNIFWIALLLAAIFVWKRRTER